MPEAIAADTHLTTHDVAKLLQVDATTVINWIKADRITAYRLPGGHRRIVARDVVIFIKAYKLPVPAALAGVKP